MRGEQMENKSRLSTTTKAWLITGALIVLAVVIFIGLAASRPAPDPGPAPRDLAAETVDQVLEQRTHFFLDIDGDGDLDYVTSAWFVRNGQPVEQVQAQPVPTPEIQRDPRPAPAD